MSATWSRQPQGLITYPALVANALRTLASQTDTNDVGRGVVQALAEVDELLVVHSLDQVVNGHGGNQLLVADSGTVLHGDNLLGSVHLGNGTLLAESLVLVGESVGDGDPDTTGTVTSRELESGIGAPVSSNLVQDDVLGHSLDIRGSNTLAEPSSLHLSCCENTSKGFAELAELTSVVGTAQTL